MKRFEKRPLEESFENPQEITSTSVLKHSRVQIGFVWSAGNKMRGAEPETMKGLSTFSLM